MRLFRYSLLFLCFALCLSCIPATAAATNEEESEETLLDVLVGKNESIINAKFPPEEWDESMNGFTWKGYPTLLIYNVTFHYNSELSFEELFYDTKQSFPTSLVVFAEEPYVITDSGEKTPLLPFDESFDFIPSFLQDIMDGSASQVFMGQKCQINNVVCIYSSHFYYGAFVILETDNGAFVRYYDRIKGPAVEYKWDDFVSLHHGYATYLSSGLAGRDKFGRPTVGLLTFGMYAKNPEGYNRKYREYIVTKNILTVVGICAVGLVVFGVTKYALKKRKEKAALESQQEATD